MLVPLASGRSSCETEIVPLTFEVRLRHAVSGPSPDGSSSTISDRFSIVATTVEWDSNGTVVFLLGNNPVAAFSAASVLQVSQNAEALAATVAPSPPSSQSAAREEPPKVEPETTTQTKTEKQKVPGRHGKSWSFEEDETLLEAYLEGWTLPELAELMQRSSHSVERRIQKLSHEPTGEDLFDEDSTDLNGESGLLDDTYDGGWDEMVAHGHKLAAYMLRDRARSKSFDALS